MAESFINMTGSSIIVVIALAKPAKNYSKISLLLTVMQYVTCLQLNKVTAMPNQGLLLGLLYSGSLGQERGTVNHRKF